MVPLPLGKGGKDSAQIKLSWSPPLEGQAKRSLATRTLAIGKYRRRVPSRAKKARAKTAEGR